MKIVVVGAGAMGCLFGGLLKKAGGDVILVDVWQEHINAINQNGLILEKNEKHFRIDIQALLPNQLDTTIDLAMVFTKTYHTETAIRNLVKLISGDTHIMTLQNGIGHIEIIERFVPATHILQGITTYPCDLVGPGHIRTQGEGYVKMMSANGKPNTMLSCVEKRLNAAGLLSEITPDVKSSIWEKLAFNGALNALTAVLGLSVGELGDAPEGRELANQIVDEIVSVAHAKNIDVEKARIMPTIKKAFESHRDHQPSMLKDILSKRRTEIDSINGAVLNESRKLNMDLKVNETIYRMVKIIERANEHVSR